MNYGSKLTAQLSVECRNSSFMRYQSNCISRNIPPSDTFARKYWYNDNIMIRPLLFLLLLLLLLLLRLLLLLLLLLLHHLLFIKFLCWQSTCMETKLISWFTMLRHLPWHRLHKNHLVEYSLEASSSCCHRILRYSAHEIEIKRSLCSINFQRKSFRSSSCLMQIFNIILTSGTGLDNANFSVPFSYVPCEWMGITKSITVSMLQADANQNIMVQYCLQ